MKEDSGSCPSGGDGIDLARYCATDSWRSVEIGKPFSHGEFSFASNGHILIRVPRRADVPENAKAPNGRAAKLFPTEPPALKPIRFAELPPYAGETEQEVECDACDGTGFEHKCPDCSCTCENCDGKKTVVEKTTPPMTAMALRGAAYDLKYVHELARLPSVSAPNKLPKDAPGYFSFDGGDALLMPLNWSEKTIPAEITAR